MTGRSATGLAIALVLLLLMAAALRLLVGSSALGWPGWEVAALRGDRLVLGLIVGVCLAVAGVALQALLRNALAEPFILGLSTGAAAGMVGQWWLGAALGIAVGGGYAGAALGAAVSMGVVYLASRRRGVIDPLGLLLTGVVWSTINGALIMLAVHLRPAVLRVELSQWMMGFLDEDAGAVMSWLRGRAALPLAAVAIGLIALGSLVILSKQARAMDAATLSADEAAALGVNLRRLRAVLFVVSSVLAAGAVVLAGPVAFVGLICPHIGRLIVGPTHRPLLWTSAALGGALVVLADTAGAAVALVFGAGIVPLGVFTAIVGGVGFLWMLRPHLGRGLG